MSSRLRLDDTLASLAGGEFILLYEDPPAWDEPRAAPTDRPSAAGYGVGSK
jgi:hypothetical protein